MRPVTLAALAAAALAAGALAGCALGPDYRRPAVDAPPAYRFEPQQTAATADIEWWKQFDDPVLDELIATALASNRNVMIAAANVSQAAAAVTVTRAPLFPQLNYSGLAGKARFSEQGTAALPTNITNPTNFYQALGLSLIHI